MIRANSTMRLSLSSDDDDDEGEEEEEKVKEEETFVRPPSLAKGAR